MHNRDRTIKARGRKIKIWRQARYIKVKGGEEVYTRLSKGEYEFRREVFDDPTNFTTLKHLAGYSYDEWTEWGARGGRPQKWNSEAERKKVARIRAKLNLGKILKPQELALLAKLGLIPKA